jgi:AMP-polyphosphate phosphotransferase
MARLRLKHFEGVPEIGDAAYETALGICEAKLARLQTAFITHKKRAVIVLEGWDASGKGGAIKRLTAPLDPRFCYVWPIAAPTESERLEHYLARFWRRLPERGQLCVFDRSWYGRVLVERVEGYADKATWKRAYGEINAFEDMLHDDGMQVVKLFLHVTQAEQDKRLIDRATTPEKRWKTGSDDYRNRARRADYTDALHDMFDKTSTAQTPWHIIAADDKKTARIAALKQILKSLSKGMDFSPPPLDAELRATAEKSLGIIFNKDGTALVEHASK